MIAPLSVTSTFKPLPAVARKQTVASPQSQGATPPTHQPAKVKVIDEWTWAKQGMLLLGGVGTVASAAMLWAIIGHKRMFTQYEGAHATIAMGGVGGMLAGGALGLLASRFLNAVHKQTARHKEP